MSRVAVVAGRTISDAGRNLVVITIMFSVGYLLGFRFQASVWAAAAMIAVTTLFGFAISWVFALIGMPVKDAETAAARQFRPHLPTDLRQQRLRRRAD